MPRPRGAGGVAVYDGRIYYAGGLAEGKAVSWFDVYDPATDTWTQLPDMPRAAGPLPGADRRRSLLRDRRAGHGCRRQHGRQRRLRLRASEWVAGLAPLPTPRGGYASALVDDGISSSEARRPIRVFAAVEAYDAEGTNVAHSRSDVGSASRYPGDRVLRRRYIAAGGEMPFGDAPSDVNSVYVTDLADRSCSRAGVTEQGSKVAFRTVRVPTGFCARRRSNSGPTGVSTSRSRGARSMPLRIHRTDQGDYKVLGLEQIES